MLFSFYVFPNLIRCLDSSLIESNDEQVLASEIERDLSEVVIHLLSVVLMPVSSCMNVFKV
jgi:hypothetical protein